MDPAGDRVLSGSWLFVPADAQLTRVFLGSAAVWGDAWRAPARVSLLRI
jgi:hypothetical protein